MAERTSGETALLSTGSGQQAALCQALRLWAEAVTSTASERRDELLAYKRKMVGSFFAFSAKHPARITPPDVGQWRHELEVEGLKPSTIYARLSFLSSFYWRAMRDPALKKHIRTNPVPRR